MITYLLSNMRTLYTPNDNIILDNSIVKCCIEVYGYRFKGCAGYNEISGVSCDSGHYS